MTGLAPEGFECSGRVRGRVHHRAQPVRDCLRWGRQLHQVGEEVVHVTCLVRPFVEAIGSKSNGKGVRRATITISTHPDQDVFELVRLQLWPPGDNSFVLDVPRHDLRAQDSHLTYNGVRCQDWHL